MITAGIDAGSRAIKIVVLDANAKTVMASGMVDQGTDQNGRAVGLFDLLLAEQDLVRDRVERIVATGYARDNMELADTTITEITCHARGVHHVVPDGRTVIEIGGQDSKLLRLDGDGSVRDFAMNDRCAAGTGRFLEIVAQRLDLDLAGLGAVAGRSNKPAPISSMCVVFAETEIIGLLASSEPLANIVAGVQASIASRIASMAGRNITPPVIFTGGVARIPGMDRALAHAMDHPVQIAPAPHMTGALGAALLAAERTLVQLSTNRGPKRLKSEPTEIR
jgi:predicted CoA-substrate-specific enzyme activase